MTKQEFKERWESSDDGGGITFNDVAEVAKEWNLYENPRIHKMDVVLSSVLRASGVSE